MPIIIIEIPAVDFDADEPTPGWNKLAAQYKAAGLRVIWVPAGWDYELHYPGAPIAGKLLRFEGEAPVYT